jgi:hypothetical protein
MRLVVDAVVRTEPTLLMLMPRTNGTRIEVCLVLGYQGTNINQCGQLKQRLLVGSTISYALHVTTFDTIL